MHPKRNRRNPFVAALLVAGAVTGLGHAQQPPIAPPPPMPAAAQPMPGQPLPSQPVGIVPGFAQPPKEPTPAVPPAEVKIDPKTGMLIVPLNGTVLWAPTLPEKPIDYVESRPDVVVIKPNPLNPTQYLLTGKMTGLAQITFSFKNFPRLVFDLMVQADLDLLRAIIRRTLPTAAIDVQPGLGNTIILSGYVTSPQDATTAQLLAVSAAANRDSVINAIQVGGVQQVQIDVVVASVDRSMARFRGVDFSVLGQTTQFQSIVSGLITSSLGEASAGTVGPTITTAANLQLGVVPWSFFLAMQALRTEGLAKFLAEPKVVTQSGRPAYFLAGGQQAILSGTSGITGPGVTLVPFGTELTVLPIVYGNGMIWLELDPKITAVSAALGITVGGSVSPGFTQQEVHSSVMLESGQTFAIGGLIQNTMQATANKVPVLGDIPFLGVGFSSVTHTMTESELVIMVTPRLVAPMNCDQLPKRLPGRETRNPDDYELFLENILEAPRGQRKVWNGHCYNAAYKCDPTAAIFPCVGGVCNGRNGPYAPNGMPRAPLAPPPGSPPPAVMPSPMPPAQLPINMPGAGPPPVRGAPVGAATVELEIGQAGGNSSSAPPVIVIPEVPRN